MPVADLFQPLIPVQLVGLAFVFASAWWLGRREEKRLTLLSPDQVTMEVEAGLLALIPPPGRPLVRTIGVTSRAG